MVRGIALCIGLNSVDPSCYDGKWDGYLAASEKDAKTMAAIAISKGFQTSLLLTEEATRQEVSERIRKVSEELQSGDIFMLSFSGHGGWIADVSGDEKDYYDETVALYDGQLLDDELDVLFSGFAKGVRIVFFSDSCHSGGIITFARPPMPGVDERPKGAIEPRTVRYKLIPEQVIHDTYRRNRTFYRNLISDTKLRLMDAKDRQARGKKDADIAGAEEGGLVIENPAKPIVASVLLYSACKDYQTAEDGLMNSLYTSRVKLAWDGGGDEDTYLQFHEKIKKMIPEKYDQEPCFRRIGQADQGFEEQKVLSI